MPCCCCSSCLTSRCCCAVEAAEFRATAASCPTLGCSLAPIQPRPAELDPAHSCPPTPPPTPPARPRRRRPPQPSPRGRPTTRAAKRRPRRASRPARRARSSSRKRCGHPSSSSWLGRLVLTSDVLGCRQSSLLDLIEQVAGKKDEERAAKVEKFVSRPAPGLPPSLLPRARVTDRSSSAVLPASRPRSRRSTRTRRSRRRSASSTGRRRSCVSLCAPRSFDPLRTT